MTPQLDQIRRWWNQPDHYDWLSGYLESQRLCGLTRLLMTMIVLTFGAMPLAMRFSPDGPPDGIRAGLAVVVSLICLGLAILWATRWPNRRQSKFFAVSSALSMTIACSIDREPQAGMLGCAGFGALAGYVAFFHTSRYLLVVVVLALGAAGVNGLRIAAEGDLVGAVAKFLVIGVGVVAVPSSAQIVLRLLGNDAANSHLDSLTGLHNRRGFLRSAQELVGRVPVVGVVMIDIDGFKQINDSRGHAAGDHILVAISDILRRVGTDDCVVARLGGEEFTIVGGLDTSAVAAMAERVCTEVAALPDDVTVSVGSAAMVCTDIPGDETRCLLDDLADAADRAMYTAKRAGGNQACHGTDLPLPAAGDA